jgi:uncharacterized NAD-dependent epimerase/dehydratase family protein
MIKRSYLLFLADAQNTADAKTALGLRDWAPEACVAQWSLPGCTVDVGIPYLAPAEAFAAGARSLLIGVAPVGGAIPPFWVPALLEALEAGLDIVSGLHDRLADIPAVAEATARLGRQLHEIRHVSRRFGVASGRPRTGKRLLTVGTDCALGKKYTALAIARELESRGREADFRATGQTGIMIAGSGVPIDAVVADFVAGAAEWLSPNAPAEHWDVIEGQGSLFHPAYAGVTLGLLHGSQPDAIVLCHDPTRLHINAYPDYPIPALEDAIDLYLRTGRLTNAAIRCVGVSMNTSRLPATEARAAMALAERRLNLPVVDPIRGGVGAIVDLLEMK